MPLSKSTIPQVVYNTPDPFSQLAEMYFINGVILEGATDPAKRWVVKEEHAYWDETAKKPQIRARTYHPSDPKECLSRTDVLIEVEKQVLRRVREGFKFQLEFDPMEAPLWYTAYEIHPDGTKTEYKIK